MCIEIRILDTHFRAFHYFNVSQVIDVWNSKLIQVILDYIIDKWNKNKNHFYSIFNYKKNQIYIITNGKMRTQTDWLYV